MPSEAIEKTLVCTLPVQLAETDDGVIVRRGGTQLFIKGQGLRSVLDLIFAIAAAGGVTRTELGDFVCQRVPSLGGGALDKLLDGLVAQRLLSEVDDPETALQTASIGGMAVLQWELGIAAQIEAKRITIIGDNPLSHQIAKALRGNAVEAITCVPDPRLGAGDDLSAGEENEPATLPAEAATCDLLVAATPFGNQDALRRWNVFAIENAIPFLPVVLNESNGLIGPLVMPGEGPCLECMRARQNSTTGNAGLMRAVEREAHLSPGAMAVLNSSIVLMGELAAIEIVKHLISPRNFDTVGGMLQCELLEPRLERKRVLKVPRCRVCSQTGKISANRLSRSIPIPTDRGE